MIAKNKKGAGADLLLEIILSSIIFFVVIAFLFMANIPQVKLKATAHVISADASLACELSLTNMLKTNSSKGITYEEWLINSFTSNSSLDPWKNEVKGLFDTALSAGQWDLNITKPDGTSVLSSGSITEGKDIDIFPCSFWVPYPVAYSKYFCAWSQSQNKVNEESADFATDDGDVSCVIIDNGDEIGINPGKDCKLNLDAPSIFAEPLPSRIEDDIEFAGDSLTLPINVGAKNIPYEITMQELSEKQTGNVSVTLTKRNTLQDCALWLTLRTTNVSVTAGL